MLEIDRISKSFGGLNVLEGINFTVAAKGIYGLIGPNGAGKTTLFNLITGFHAPDSGSMRFKGGELKGRRAHEITQLGIARTFQNIRLFETLTVLENVHLAQNIRTRSGIMSLFLPEGTAGRKLRRQAQEILERLGLWAKRHEQSTSLSYGDQRRLEIARALALSPELLLLDEPAAGMNETESDDLLARICDIRDMGITVLMIEHDMKVVMGICDQIGVLNFGSLIAEGTPEEIQSNPDVIEAYLGVEDEEAGYA